MEERKSLWNANENDGSNAVITHVARLQAQQQNIGENKTKIFLHENDIQF